EKADAVGPKRRRDLHAPLEQPRPDPATQYVEGNANKRIRQQPAERGARDRRTQCVEIGPPQRQPECASTDADSKTKPHRRPAASAIHETRTVTLPDPASDTDAARANPAQAADST